VTKKILSRFFLVAALLAVLVGAYSLMQMSVAQGAETAIPSYGAPAYLDGSPVGGGAGYLDIVYPSQAKYVVSTAAALKSALAAATSGQIVYVADGATITINSSNWFGKNSSSVGTGCFVKAGVTLAGGRGRAGVTGGIIKVDPALQPTTFSVLIWLAGAGSRICGLTLVGAQEGTSGGNMWCGIWAGDNANIYNNEIRGFGCAAVRVDWDITGVWIHHNYIHHNQATGSGYGVYVNASSIYHTASAIVEGNRFDYSRHVMCGSRGRVSYVFRYNYLGANCTNTQIDVHGQNAGGDYLDRTSAGEYIYCAGENVKIYNNTSVCTNNPFVGIRGIPYSTGSVSVHNNWTYTTATQEWQLSSDRPKVRTINQQMDNIPGYGYMAPNGGNFVRMSSYDNWYGTKAPPDYSPSAANQPPLTPAAPSGTASGVTGTSYTYKVKTTDPDGDTITYTLDWGDGTSYTTSSKTSGTTAYPTHSWAKSGTYAVKVRATDSKGNVSAWSPSLSVVIASAAPVDTAALAVPTLLSPANGASTSDSTPFLDWSTVTAATLVYYQLQVDNNADFSSPVISKTSVKWSYLTVSTTTALPDGLPDGKYYWRVRAVDEEGNMSVWTASWSFTVI